MGLDLTQAMQLSKQLIAHGRNGDITLYREAAERGVSLSNLLEELDPSSDEMKAQHMTAFDRQLLLFELTLPGIVVDDFFVKSAQLLLPEYMQRELAAGYVLTTNPETLLAAVVSEKGPTINPIYLKTTEAVKPAAKRNEAAGYPVSSITYRDKPLAMVDRGRELDFSYKVLRNQQLPEFQVFLRYLGAQFAMDEIDEIYNVVLNGDGTSAGAVDTFAGAAGTLAYADLITLAMAFNRPAACTHIIGNKAAISELLNLAEFKDPAVWLAMSQLQLENKYTGLLPINLQLVVAPNGTTDIIVALDSRFALRESVAQGLMIEADKVIAQKLEKSVISKEAVVSIMVDDAIRKCDFTV